MVHLVVYGRSYCHLCEDMMRALEALQPRYGFTVEMVDIDGDADLERLYGDKVPVLTDGAQELCHYFLDEPALAAYFARRRSPSG